MPRTPPQKKPQKKTPAQALADKLANMHAEGFRTGLETARDSIASFLRRHAKSPFIQGETRLTKHVVLELALAIEKDLWRSFPTSGSLSSTPTTASAPADTPGSRPRRARSRS